MLNYGEDVLKGMPIYKIFRRILRLLLKCDTYLFKLLYAGTFTIYSLFYIFIRNFFFQIYTL